MKNSDLVALAIAAREKSYSPYSGFKVGAALLTSDGKVYCGCNIENAAFGPTNCAERTAIFNAVSCGDRDFLKIAIVGGKDSISEKCFPCGVCRQVMAEFCREDFEIIVASGVEDYSIYKLSDLLPNGFYPEKLKD